MANTKLLIISSVVAAAFITTPLVVSSHVESKIKANQAWLEANGFKQEFTTKSGYFTAKRDFTLEVVDAKKVRDMLLDKFVAKNAHYKVFAQALKEDTDSDINSALDGLGFKGQIAHSNFLPSDMELSLSLSKLPTDTNAEASKILWPLVQKGVFAADMRFGTNEKLKELKLRDINEKIKVEEGLTFDVDTSKQHLTLSEKGEDIKGLFTIEKQRFAALSDTFDFVSQIDGLSYDFIYKNEVNNEAVSSLSSYLLKAKDNTSSAKVEIKNLKSSGSVSEKDKTLYVKGDYLFDDFLLESDGETISTKKLNVAIDINGINMDTFSRLQSNTKESEQMVKDMLTLLNQGLYLGLNVKADRLDSDVLKLQNFSVETALNIEKNSYSLKDSPFAILGLLDISSKVKIHKDDRMKLQGLGLASAKEFAMGRVEGDFFIYDITLKKGLLRVNDKAIE